MPLGSLPIAPAVCRQSPVRECLEELVHRCTQAMRGERSLLMSCDDDAWREMSKGAGFEELVMAMPGAFSVFFPSDKPDAEGKWPGVDLRARYGEKVQLHASALAKARAILIVGRASVTGSAARNDELARLRATFVEGLVREALGPGVPEIRGWGLAS